LRSAKFEQGEEKMLRCVFTLTFWFYLDAVYADMGKIVRLGDKSEAHLERSRQKIVLQPGTRIKHGDKIFSSSSDVLLLIYPATQLSLTKQSQLIIKNNSLLVVQKGGGRFKSKEQLNIKTTDVAFSTHGTEFEVVLAKSFVDLDVLSGMVEVTSPHVHTFVPEIVKANEGFRFDRKKRQFIRREFKSRFKELGAGTKPHS
jgi:hypothetical protein